MSNPQQPGQFNAPQGGPQGAPLPPPQGAPVPPPYQPQAGGTPPQGFPPAPGAVPPPPAKRGGGKLVRIIVAIVVALAGIGFAAYRAMDDVDTAEAGDCIQLKSMDSSNNVDLDKIDCGSPDASYKVGKKLDGSGAKCPEGDYDEFYKSGSSGYKVCVYYNAAKGDCLTDLKTKPHKVACTAAHEAEVVEVVQGKSAAGTCAATLPEDDAVAEQNFSEPPLTMCFHAKA
ncbi:hypothetical protein V5P93_000575 [Actinokineospora auranticolor]|uniref:Uncharacterized protein n=1 Tax=Actinokineospora auranticolor TaxID=155976 RepID=A0A2S6GZ78_9PSEU|nr:hypothetical protein [Actinokineospora auranticolor]PPK70545.1 hypothetical protein CLV40_102460 [Actinokineospora auranticolor]